MQFYRHKPDFKIALEKSQARVLDLLGRLDGKPDFERWLQQNGKRADEVYLQYLTARDGTAWLVFDRDADLLGYFEVDEES